LFLFDIIFLYFPIRNAQRYVIDNIIVNIIMFGIVIAAYRY